VTLPIRVYDKGINVLERYTVLFMFDPLGGGYYVGRRLGMSTDINYMTTDKPGKHHGLLVTLGDLPKYGQEIIHELLRDYTTVRTKENEKEESEESAQPL